MLVHHCMMFISWANPEKCIVYKQRFIGLFLRVFGSFTCYESFWIYFCFIFFFFGSLREYDLAISLPFLRSFVFRLHGDRFFFNILFSSWCVFSSRWSKLSVFVEGQNIANCISYSCFMDRLVSWQTRCFRVFLFFSFLSSPSSS